MFGYIRPVKNEFDNYLFKSQYCGLCKTLGKRYGQFSRLFLSYDITLLTLILHAFSGKCFFYRYENCIVHPVNKRRVKKISEIDLLAADISVYFAQKKIQDNIKDERLMKRLSNQLLKSLPMKWNQIVPIEKEDLENLFSALSKLEDLKKTGMDEISNYFGLILKTLTFHTTEKLSIKLPEHFEEFVFLIGKLIYTLDAFEDLEKDLKKWNYNPFIFENKEIILTNDKINNSLKEIRQKEKWRVKLLLDHISYSYSFFRNYLGVYHLEIDGIISKSLPAMGYRVIGEDMICQNKGDFHE